MASYAIPLAALIVAAASFVGSSVLAAKQAQRSASSEWVETLEGKVDLQREDLEACKRELAECRADRKRLHEEVNRLSEREILLMRRVLSLEGG